MNPEPRSARPAFLRAMSAYMRAQTKTELPTSLRRLQNLRPKDLARHSSVLLAALDDEVLRALIVEWLDADPSGIRKDDAETLRSAAERAPGWEEIAMAPIVTAATATVRSSTSDTTDNRLERERRRLAKARAGEESARRDLQTAQAELASARKELGSVRAELDDAKRDAKSAHAELERQKTVHEREMRKAQRAVAAAEEDAKETRRDLQEARRAIARLEREKARSSRSPRKTPPEAAVVVREAPAERVALRVPKGRLADAPETLDEWLATPDVTLLVDGYNVTKSSAGFGELELEAQRGRLLQGLSSLSRKKEAAIVVVFDGAESPAPAGRRARGPVKVEYSRPPEIADDHIVRRLTELPRYPVVVATNDRELQERARAEGATIATSDQLLALIR